MAPRGPRARPVRTPLGPGRRLGDRSLRARHRCGPEPPGPKRASVPAEECGAERDNAGQRPRPPGEGSAAAGPLGGERGEQGRRNNPRPRPGRGRAAVAMVTAGSARAVQEPRAGAGRCGRGALMAHYKVGGSEPERGWCGSAEPAARRGRPGTGTAAVLRAAAAAAERGGGPVRRAGSVSRGGGAADLTVWASSLRPRTPSGSSSAGTWRSRGCWTRSPRVSPRLACCRPGSPWGVSAGGGRSPRVTLGLPRRCPAAPRPGSRSPVLLSLRGGRALPESSERRLEWRPSRAAAGRTALSPPRGHGAPRGNKVPPGNAAPSPVHGVWGRNG